MKQSDKHARMFTLCGSLRAESYTRAVLRGQQEALPPRIALEMHDSNLPLYNEDDDGDDAPDQVCEFRRALRESDALIVATPEYNHGIPGVLKNALDWASRPLGDAALTGKVVLVVSVSPAFTGGVKAQVQVNETLLSAAAYPLGGPQVVIGNVAAKIRDGKLGGSANLGFALAAVERLLQAC